MKQYKLFNSLFGWLSFAIAAAVYLVTMEPTASFWDCGEFISTAFKLEVGHPPGAALFMILARFFTLFAFGDVTKVAIMVNAMSALASAATILFLFWTITHLARKIIIKTDSDFNAGNIIAILGAGLVGAMAYTFSDTFWFSAVEGEVYASSSLFTALVFWAILKWEDVAHQRHANRWLILIAYLMGLSIGVHLLNLLAIPAIVFVYYFKKYTVTRKGLISATVISVLLLAGVMYGIIQGVITVGAAFERLFVNGFSLPYNTGVFFFLIGLVALLVWGIYYTYKRGKVLLNTIILGVTVILIGYSSVAMIVIRSNADTPLNENDPSNMFALLAYLNREQYGDRPLLSGPTFNAPIIDYVQGKPVLTPINGKYEITNHKISYKYDERFITIFPRMFSQEADHVKAYKDWGDVKGTPISVTNNKGEAETIMKPTFAENLRFFVYYQVGFMYMRYFMWNFVGRQNDIQGHGDILKGNWLSGIKFIDEKRLGPQDNLPDSLAKNKGRNKYYFLPFILGLVGLFYQYNKDRKDFTTVALLFFFTGIAILLYLNQTPYQPRERDYAYAGSFYAFTIWIGLGVLSLYELLGKKIHGGIRAVLVTIVCMLCVPTLMAKENWDDHDRSNRYTARDFASNYLNSCSPNAIIFTNGDNDTFPLWYAQEVEGIRTDVRVVNLSYLGADWYINQMHKKAYESERLPLSLTKEKIIQGKRDLVYLIERTKDPIELKDAIDFVGSDDERTKQINGYNERVDYFPSKNFQITIDTATIIKNNVVSVSMQKNIVDKMVWNINRNYITKSDLMVLDLLAQNNWKRPVYFAITVSRDNYLNMESYFQSHGLAYKIVPIKTSTEYGDVSAIDADTMYNNMMHKFKWGGINNPKVYLDENNMRMLSNLRNNFAKLSDELINQGKRDSALKVLNKCLEVTPHNCVAYNYFMIPIIENYYKLGQTNKANEIVKILSATYEKELKYYFKLKGKQANAVDYEKRIGLHIYQEMTRLTGTYKQTELNKDLDVKTKSFIEQYSAVQP